MKKVAVIMLTLALTVGLSACSSHEKVTNNVENSTIHLTHTNVNEAEIADVIIVHGDRLVFPTLELLLEWGTDLVVIGEFTEETDTKFDYSYDERFNMEVVVDAFAHNQMRIVEVLNGDIEVGKYITMFQRYSFEERDEGTVLISFGELTPMNKGDRWIYFLKHEDTAGQFSGMYYSNYRFPVPNPEMIDVKSELIPLNKKMGEFMGRELNEEEMAELEPLLVKWDNITGRVDTSSLGMFNRNGFNFGLYAEIIEHFQIEAQDWVNPGRAFDARLVELVEAQMQSAANCNQ